MFFFEAVLDFFKDLKNNKISSKVFLKRLILCFFGFSSNDFDNYCLSERKIYEVINDFIPYYRRKKIRGNDKSPSVEILQNKYETLKILHKNMIPTTIPRYLIVNGVMYRLTGNIEVANITSTIVAGDYVIKPTSLRWGEGVTFLLIDKSLNILKDPEIQSSIDAFRVLLIEDRVINHLEMERLSSFSLNTLRIVTIRLKSDNIIVAFACVRFSSTDAKIDNWSSGGYAANIDISTGVAQCAVKKNTKVLDSYNKVTEGFVVPFFEDAKQIALNAHELFKDMKSIGWDIAITPNGVLIIEGNDDWDVILPQKLLQKGIKKVLCKK